MQVKLRPNGSHGDDDSGDDDSDDDDDDDDVSGSGSGFMSGSHPNPLTSGKV